MLSTLRGPDGGPSGRVRVLAALVILGLLALAAPVVLVLFRFLLDLLI